MPVSTADKTAITLRIPADFYESIGKKATVMGISINSFLLTLLNLGIKAYEKTN